MPLEFALRPRFNLERPAPQRKLRKARLSPLALPMLAYWLLMAGATHLLVRSVAEPPAEARPTPPARDLWQAPPMAAASEPKLDLEPAFAPSAQAPEPVAPRLAERPATVAPVDDPAPARSNEKREASVSRAASVANSTSLPSCESAAASANETMDLRAAPGAPDLSRDALASVLENGSYLTGCAIPARTALEICAAVQDGKAVGVTVTSEPRNASVSACVRRSVAGLHFPRSARLDVTRTRFEAAR